MSETNILGDKKKMGKAADFIVMAQPVKAASGAAGICFSVYNTCPWTTF